MSESKKTSSPLRVSPQAVLKITKSERTRAAILNAALDFTWSHPFHEMTVNSLMASTGLSRAAFYQYFKDLQDLMETLLDMLKDEIYVDVAPWLTETGDPVALMHKSLDGLVRICYERGPFLRAISDAAATDKRIEKAWSDFLVQFDEAGCARIKADQEQGLIPDFDPRPVMFALNRLNALTVIDAFGQHPRSEPEPVREALGRIWTSSLYGIEWLKTGSSNLVRT